MNRMGNLENNRGRTARVLAVVMAVMGCGLGLHGAQTATWITAWGDNSAQQCNLPPSSVEPVAVAAGDVHSLVLRSDGTVLGWGFNGFGQAAVPSDLADVVEVSAGGAYSLALLANGQVRQWGSHTPVPAGLANVSAIAAGFDHSLALKRDGTVVAWGSDTSVPAGMSNVVAIAAGTGHSLALLTDGTVRAWGDDSFFKTEVPAGLSNVIAIAAGRDHCLALKRDGTVAVWGAHYAGQTATPAGLSNVIAIAAGALHNLALKDNGSVVAWGDNGFNQCGVSTVATNFVGLAAGSGHSVALLGLGTPAVVLEPRDRMIYAGNQVAFEVIATGTKPLSYQWQLNGVDILAATNAVLVVTNAQAANAGQYTVRVANPLGWRVSRAATLTLMFAAPTFATEPQDQTLHCGDDLVLAPILNGSGPFAAQWYYNGEQISWGTNTILVMTNAGPGAAGTYWLWAANDLGTTVSRAATVTVIERGPEITSVLRDENLAQGFDYTYQITALHGAKQYSAAGLPDGLTVDQETGLISGVPLESGWFAPSIGARNDCGWGHADLLLYVDYADVRPFYFSFSAIEGEYAEGWVWLSYYLDYPPYFLPGRLAPGLEVDNMTGDVFGTPTMPGDYINTVICTNEWGTNTATFYSYISNRVVSGLSMSDVTYNYSPPYLLDFEFTLRDELGLPVVTNPKFLTAQCTEDGTPISPTESGSFTDRISAKPVKAFLVLDFSLSMSSLSNGDSNTNGLSDAVELLVTSAQEFVRQQSTNTLIGVYEFHRDDRDPQKVMDLTTDQDALMNAIAGIWTNYVRNWSAGSRCWDALNAAITDFGSPNPDEVRMIVCVSDGKDDSSEAILTDLIDLAVTNQVKISCLGFGGELDPTPLQQLAADTGGKYFSATTPKDLQTQFALLSRETKGRYALRWPTMKRATDFGPRFEISFQGFTATPSDDVVYEDTNAPPIIDTNTVPPTTNFPLVTNLTFDRFDPKKYKGDVTVGGLRLVSEAVINPPAVVLRASYIPRYVRQFRIHYRPNWPCTVSLLSRGQGELLYGWSLSETNDGAGGKWLTLSSRFPQYSSNSLPYAAFGNLVRFAFRDLKSATNTFSLFEVDNTIYESTGGQSFVLDAGSLTGFVSEYPLLPQGTPVPWLMEHGVSSGFEQAEWADTDGDGVPAWKEFRANTDPANSASKLVITSLWRKPNHRFEVTFNAMTNRFYQLESSTNLVTWQTNLTNLKTAVDGPVTITDTAARPSLKQIYYRVNAY